MPMRRLLLALMLIVSSAWPAAAQPSGLPPHRSHTVAGYGGVVLNVQEWGNPSGSVILFVHGGAQSFLSWRRQVSDPALLAEFRLITFDLRGHGFSGKPEGDAHYRPAEPWAGDLDAIIRKLGLNHPTLVGWSFGGRVVSDYLQVHGTAGIAAINFVSSVTSSEPRYFGPGSAYLRTFTSEDMETMVAASIAFARACFEVPPSPAEFQAIIAYNMLTPRHVRVSMGGRRAEYDSVLRGLNLPVLVTHGEADSVLLPSLGRYTADAVPNARLSLYPGVGHSPFWEDADRFNRELAIFVRDANGPREGGK